MKKIITIIAVLLLSTQVNASLISLDINQNSAQVGDTLVANVLLSNIETDQNGFQKLLSGFNFDLVFDQNLFSIGNVSFGSKLNVDAFLPSDTFVSPNVLGFNFAEISYAFFGDLFNAQNGLSQFTLLTVELNALTAGVAQLSFDNIVLTDDLGLSFNQVQGSTTNLTIQNTQVPEPTSWALLVLALIMAFYARAKRVN